MAMLRLFRFNVRKYGPSPDLEYSGFSLSAVRVISPLAGGLDLDGLAPMSASSIVA